MHVTGAPDTLLDVTPRPVGALVPASRAETAEDGTADLTP
jgi:hypothetical protein